MGLSRRWFLGLLGAAGISAVASHENEWADIDEADAEGGDFSADYQPTAISEAFIRQYERDVHAIFKRHGGVLRKEII
jgi:hypothetical protein